jgi:hypothetical protein
MLRVRPIVATSRLAEDRRILEALGMVVTEEAQGWAVLDAGGGRVELRDAGGPATGAAEGAAAGTITFGVEIRDPEEFARRTEDDGGNAALVRGPQGTRVRIAGPDGFSFYADPTSHGAQCADADPGLTVRLVWRTPDLPGVAAALAAIGARPRHTAEPPTESARGTEFTAKNGGALVAEAAAAPGAALAFECDGDLAAVVRRLAEAGATVGTSPLGFAVTTPGGAEFTVVEATSRS